jgi:hypothetical protein
LSRDPSSISNVKGGIIGLNIGPDYGGSHVEIITSYGDAFYILPQNLGTDVATIIKTAQDSWRAKQGNIPSPPNA